jgi:hypothetical protein
MAEKIDEADRQRSWAKIKSVEKNQPKPRRPDQGLVELAVPPIRPPEAMPDPLVLDKLTHPQRQAFKRMALHPNDVLGLGQMRCITVSALRNHTGCADDPADLAAPRADDSWPGRRRNREFAGRDGRELSV